MNIYLVHTDKHNTLTETNKKRALATAKKCGCVVNSMPYNLYKDGLYPYGWDYTTFISQSIRIADYS